MSGALIKLGTKVAANPKRAIAVAVPVLIETGTVLAPFAIAGAVGYGVYRLCKWVIE